MVFNYMYVLIVIIVLNTDITNYKSKNKTSFGFKCPFRDRPFDMMGGWDFSSRQVIFFSLFAQQGIFLKSKL